MQKPRVGFTLGLEGLVGWRERSAVRRVRHIGKKTVVSMPTELISEILAAGRKIQIGIVPTDVYDTPTYETLTTARQALVALAPSELQDLFGEAEMLKTWQEWQAYEKRLVGAALERARVVTTPFFGERARCPFCGDWPADPGPTEGFAYPDGLTRHLTGSYNARHCVVTRALMDWGRSSV